MEASLFRYIWRQTRREQIWILFVILASMPFNFAMLDLPKYIVNGPIQAKGFEKATSTQHFFQIRIPLPTAVSHAGFIEVLHGFDLSRMWSLVVLSALFLILVIVNGLFKFYINFYKGRLGERMLGQLRYELIDRVLRFPPSEFRRIKGAEIATMIKDEVEPLGGFIGDAFVQPVFLGGQILTAIIFILVQNFSLGLIAVTLLLVQGVVIPRLRRRQLILGRQRQLTARALAGRIGEIVDDIPNIHTNEASDYQRADIASRLIQIFRIRFALYQWKFFVKFLNNLLAQITPFLFYMVGGLLAIMGLLDIGQLVAVISAYKDLPSPVKDLIDWDQMRLDVEVKYNQVIEQFSVDPSVELLPAPDHSGPVPPITGEIALSGVTVLNSTGTRMLDNVSLHMAVSDLVGIDGGPTSGAETIIEVLARLVTVNAGRVTLGGRDLKDYPPAVTGRRISLVQAETFFPQCTIADALLYGIRHPQSEGRTRDHAEVIKARGNVLDIEADWVDYAAAGATGPADIVDHMRRALELSDLDDDVVSFGFNRRLPEVSEDVAARFIEARAMFRERLAEAGLTHLVESFEPDRYNTQSSIGENLVFGTPIDDSFDPRRLGGNAIVRRVLNSLALDATLFDMGRNIASTILEVFEGLEADSPLFEQLSLMAPEQFPDYAASLKRTGGRPFRQASAADQALFLDLAFGYVEPRDRLGLLDEETMARLVEARHAFHAALDASETAAIAFYDPDVFNVAASVQDNVLMGRVAFGIAEAERRVAALARGVLDDLGMRPIVFEAGLAFNIGSGGKRLSAAQRQKLALARAVLRRPNLLLVHRGLVQLDPQSQQTIVGRLAESARGTGTDEQPGFGLIWVMENSSLSHHFDRIIVMESGRIASDTGAQVTDPGGDDQELMRASA